TDAAPLYDAALHTRIHSEAIRAIAGYHHRVAERDRYQTDVKQRAERLLRIAQTAYREGARGILELVDAYRTSREVRLRDLELRTAVEGTGFDIAEAVGDLTAYAAAVTP